MTYPLTPGRWQAIVHCVLVAVLVLASAVALDGASTARAEADERLAPESGPPVTPLSAGSGEASDLADDLIGAIARPELAPRVLEATYEGVSEQAGVFTSQLQEFPRTGNQYVVLSTGPAASTPGVATTFLSVSMGGVHIPGGSPDGFDAYDVATLTGQTRPGGSAHGSGAAAGVPVQVLLRGAAHLLGQRVPGLLHGHGARRGRAGAPEHRRAPERAAVHDRQRAPVHEPGDRQLDVPAAAVPEPERLVFNACTGIHTTDFDLTAFVDDEIELELQIGDVGDAAYDSAVFIDGLEVHAGPLPDFWVERVEFNQASQSFAPGQVVAADQLASGKTTGVRVHVVGDDNEDDPQEVSAELHVLRNGNPVAGSPFAPGPTRTCASQSPGSRPSTRKR